MGQHTPGCRPVNATRNDIEKGCLVQLADGRTMSAFHIVGVDLELGFGIDLGVGGEQQVLVALRRVGFLRTRLHHDSAMKHRVATVTEHAFVTLAAGALGRVMRNMGVVVDMTAPESKVDPVKARVSPLSIQIDPGIIAYPCLSHGYRRRFEFCGFGQTGKQAAHVEGAFSLILHTAEIQRRVFFQNDFGKCITERPLLTEREMTLDDIRLAALPEYHQITRQAQEALPAAPRNKQQFNGLFQLHPRCDLHEGAVTDKCGVHCRKSMRDLPHDRSQPVSDRFRFLRQRISKARNLNTLRQTVCLRTARQIKAICEYQLPGIKVLDHRSGDKVFRAVIPRYRRAEPGTGNRLDGGVLPVLIALGWQASLAEQVQCFCAAAIKRRDARCRQLASLALLRLDIGRGVSFYSAHAVAVLAEVSIQL